TRALPSLERMLASACTTRRLWSRQNVRRLPRLGPTAPRRSRTSDDTPDRRESSRLDSERGPRANTAEDTTSRPAWCGTPHRSSCMSDERSSHNCRFYLCCRSIAAIRRQSCHLSSDGRTRRSRRSLADPHDRWRPSAEHQRRVGLHPRYRSPKPPATFAASHQPPRPSVRCSFAAVAPTGHARRSPTFYAAPFGRNLRRIPPKTTPTPAPNSKADSWSSVTSQFILQDETAKSYHKTTYKGKCAVVLFRTSPP